MSAKEPSRHNSEQKSPSVKASKSGFFFRPHSKKWRVIWVSLVLLSLTVVNNTEKMIPATATARGVLSA